jgi:hypothetical protein
MKPASVSRSSSIAWASPVIRWPSTASRSTPPIVCALRTAMLTCTPAKASPIAVGTAISAISRQDTRQFSRTSFGRARRPGRARPDGAAWG